MEKVIQPEGNFYDKYNNKNFIVKKIMGGFFDAIENILSEISFETVLETGCGEGYVSEFIYKTRKPKIDAFDISEAVIDEAAKNFKFVNFSVGSIYDIDKPDNSYDLVIASEVLEHLEEPEKALAEIFRTSKRYVLVSVPNEPLWRILNFCRGKYIKNLGNTPGHIQHWSKQSFREFVGEDNILKMENPLPWTMILLEKKKIV